MNIADSPDHTNAGKTGVRALDDLFQAFNRSDAPGLVVGVAQHGNTLYRRAFGLASVELGVANTPWTRMRIGSTSKHFTCLAVLLLAEEGKVDPDASVRRYLPELPPLHGEPSLRQLMSHTGGYRCHLDLEFIASGMAMQPKGTALTTLLRQTAANFAPGESSLYCNGGYHLLSLVVARISGISFEQFMHERIFAPLSMVDTASVPSDLEIHRGMATLHLPKPDGSWTRGIFPSEELLGEGAIISTLDDMLRWLAHLRGTKTVGSEATWAQMKTLSRLNDGSTAPYALGLMRHDYRGLDIIHHAGGVIGGSSQMLTVPSHELDVIIMTNGAMANPIELANQIVDAMLGEALGPRTEKAAAERFRPLPGTRYHAKRTGHVIGFNEVGGKLGLAFLNSPAIPLTDAGDTLRIGFQELAAGPLSLPVAQLAGIVEAPTTLQFSEAGNTSTFERLPAVAPSLAEVGAALVGRYHATDLGADAEIRFDGNALNLYVYGAHAVSVLPLEAFSAEVFGLVSSIAVLSLRGVLNVERKDGRVTGFFIHTMRTRHLPFVRRD
ncbi:serine hydrolase domain-containing protein [Pseudomonas mucidolens]|uniref:CubicO group peptidase, beta-lactamase class C family n=1 Tax=Pseudomonas mucidolens TaxID=46679 RepID=A0A1H2MQ75_9PSED|nr:serine hydrolase domain-containing protein [Pseudomonas mucidolens]SDU95224.1 CubicO group peptidase, beta-lactamase class C family [Pseudomonas mucidolens]SQH33454.1 penicillin-binding protein [Pseudomonas mucidolens]